MSRTPCSSINQGVDHARQSWMLRCNALFFALRSKVRWSRAGYRESPGQGTPLSRAEAALLNGPRASGLTARYGLAPLRAHLAQRTWQINLVYADLTEKILRTSVLWPGGPTPLKDASQTMRVLDIGSKNFGYAPALAAVLRAATRRPVALTGLEIDPWRVYPNLHSRSDAAHYYLSLLGPAPAGGQGHRYLPGDLLEHTPPAQRYNLITWFYPFVLPRALAGWGLPHRCLQPQALLDQALKMLAPGSVLVVVNQTAREARAQTVLLKHAGCTFERLRLTLNLMPEAPSRWAFVVRPGVDQALPKPVTPLTTGLAHSHRLRRRAFRLR